MYQNESKILASQALIPSIRELMSLLKVTQKLHTQNQYSQVVDFVDYFSRVTIEWE